MKGPEQGMGIREERGGPRGPEQGMGIREERGKPRKEGWGRMGIGRKGEAPKKEEKNFKGRG